LAHGNIHPGSSRACKTEENDPAEEIAQVVGTADDDDTEIEASRTYKKKFSVMNNLVNSHALWTSMNEYVDLNASRVRSIAAVGSNDAMFQMHALH
jgi:hypothetical protein